MTSELEILLLHVCLHTFFYFLHFPSFFYIYIYIYIYPKKNYVKLRRKALLLSLSLLSLTFIPRSNWRATSELQLSRTLLNFVIYLSNALVGTISILTQISSPLSLLRILRDSPSCSHYDWHCQYLQIR